jgi:hypothetical protein
MALTIIGEIGASGGIEADKWLALISSHDALANVPPRMGINPFTRQRCEYKTPASSALIRQSDADIGLIYSAMDGSPKLIVQAREDSVDAVSRVAAEIASALGGRFVRQPLEK